MRVLFVCYPHIGLSTGGMRRQLDATARSLRSLGVEVKYLDIWQNQIDDIDLIHVFGCQASEWSHVAYARQSGKPVVVSPVLSVFGRPLWKYLLATRCTYHLPLVGGFAKQTRRILQTANRVLVLQPAEQRALSTLFAIPNQKMTLIPNGVDRIFAEATPDLFVKRYGLHDFVLNAACISPNKNQLGLIRAVRGTPFDLVIAGAPLDGGQDYLLQCKQEAGSNVYFLGAFPYGDPLLKSAYAAARVFALPSYSEVMPLSLMEAALSDCRLVGSSRYPVQAALAPYVFRPDPSRYKDIRCAIEQAYDDPRSARDVMLAEPDWPEVGRRILGVYEEVIRDCGAVAPTPVQVSMEGS